MSYSDLSSVEQKMQHYSNEYICEDCIKDNGLESIVNCNGSVQKCRYCNQIKENTVDIPSAFKELENEIANHYYSANDSMPIENSEFIGETLKIYNIIGNFCSIKDTKLYNDIVYDVFAEEIYDACTKEDLEYDYYSSEWFSFRQNVLYKKRFFQNELNFLNLLNNFIINNNLFKTIDVNCSFYRIRIGKYNNITDLYPPPKEKTPDNRMNPKGIPMFYCSKEEETAIQEVGISKNQEIITVAKFNNLKSLYVLDFSNITTKAENVEAIFLLSFINDISKPLTVQDINKLSYIPTQIITEYFRYFLTDENKKNINIDGICYKSSINNGINYVFFYDDKNIQEKFELKNTNIKHKRIIKITKKFDIQEIIF